MEFISIVLIGAGLGLVALLVLLGRRDARARRLDAMPGSSIHPRERVEAEAHAHAGHIARQGGGVSVGGF